MGGVRGVGRRVCERVRGVRRRVCERIGGGGKEVYIYIEHSSVRSKINLVSKSIRIAIRIGPVCTTAGSVTNVTAQIEKGHAC